MTTHYQENLQRDIDRIKAKVTRMGALVKEALTRSLRALAERNRQMVAAAG